MKSVSNVLIALILAVWSVAIAILSVQNAFVIDESGQPQLVSLRFLGFQSIQLPLGVILTLAFAVGVLGTALILVILRRSSVS